MKYLAVLGRLSKISLAELEAQFGDSVRQIAPALAVFESKTRPDINRFGGVMKFGELINAASLKQKSGEKPSKSDRAAGSKSQEKALLAFLQEVAPSGKIVLGVSDYGRHANSRTSQHEAMKLKKILGRAGRSVRVLMNDKNGTLSTATAHHNQLGEKPGHLELIKVGSEWYLGCGVQNITAYAKRDQARPARDAKVGMLPPKLAQILINLCGPLPDGATVLDPFCGTGVVLQEAMLMGYRPLGTDLSPRMAKYSVKNLKWLLDGDYSMNYPSVSVKAQRLRGNFDFETRVQEGDATDTDWNEILKKDRPAASSRDASSRTAANRTSTSSRASAASLPAANQKISAVACEIYLGSPMSQPPVEIKLKSEKQECGRILLGFLKNIHPQLETGTPLALAIPAWLRPDGTYARLNLLDKITEAGYNVIKFRSLTQDDLLYFRDGQIVAREIIVLRKK